MQMPEETAQDALEQFAMAKASGNIQFFRFTLDETVCLFKSPEEGAALRAAKSTLAEMEAYEAIHGEGSLLKMEHPINRVIFRQASACSSSLLV
jgi:hypothetical protein